jgi:hypothetical protein
MKMTKTHKRLYIITGPAASRSMPPASEFRHPVSHSSIGVLWYRTGSPYSIPDWFSNCDFCSFWYRTERMPDSLIFKKGYTLHIHTAGGGKAYTLHTAHCTYILLAVEMDTPCTSILQVVKGKTPCTSILLAVERDTSCHSAGCGNGYTLYISTTGGGKGQTAGCRNEYFLHVHTAGQLVLVVVKGISSARPNYILWKGIHLARPETVADGVILTI